MNNYIPTEVKDLTDSKQRVMRKVVNKIENNSRRPKLKWRYVVITAVLTVSVMLFVLNEIFIEKEQHFATDKPIENEQQPATDKPIEKEQQPVTEIHLDVTQPTFSEEQGLLYLRGVTLGDPQTKVIEHLGENYTIYEIEDGSRADLVLDYDGDLRTYFYEDKLDSIVFTKVDEDYFDELFTNYDGFKFGAVDSDRFIYSEETTQILKATKVPDGSFQLYLFYAGPDLYENPDYLKMKQSLD